MNNDNKYILEITDKAIEYIRNNAGWMSKVDVLDELLPIQAAALVIWRYKNGLIGEDTYERYEPIRKTYRAVDRDGDNPLF